MLNVINLSSEQAWHVPMYNNGVADGLEELDLPLLPNLKN